MTGRVLTPGERLSLTTKGGAHRRYVRLVRQRGGYCDVLGLGGDVRGVEFAVPTSNLVRLSPPARTATARSRPTSTPEVAGGGGAAAVTAGG